MKRGSKHTEKARAYIAARTRAELAKRRAARRITASEVAHVVREGTISEKLRPYALQAAEEATFLAPAIGGLEASEQRQVLAEDIGRLGLVLRVLVAKFLQGEGDPELATKISTIVGQRRQSLVALGLERFEHDALNVGSYQAALAAQERAGRANASDPDPHIEDATEAGAAPEDASEEGA